MAVWSGVKISALSERMRLDAEHYQPAYLRFAARARSGSSLRDVVREIIHPAELTRAYEEEGIAILLAQNIRPFRLDFSVRAYMPPKVRPLLVRSLLAEGDVVMTRSGANFGDTACYFGPPNGIPEYFACADCLVLKPKSVLPGYLAAYFNSRMGRALLTRGAYGAAQPHIAPSYLWTMFLPRIGDAEEEVHQKVVEAWKHKQRSSDVFEKAEAALVISLGLGNLDTSVTLGYARKFANLQTANRFGAEYFMPCKQRALDGLAAKPGKPLGAHCESVREMFDPTDARRGEQMRNFDLTDALEPVLDDRMAPMPAAEIGSMKKRFQAGDLVISRLRSYLREIALVRTSPAVPAVGSSEFIVLRRRTTGKGSLTPETLLVFLRSVPVQTILKWSQDGSQHPRFNETDLLAIPVPDAVLAAAPRIDALVHEALTARAAAGRLLEEAKAEVESLVLGSGK